MKRRTGGVLIITVLLLSVLALPAAAQPGGENVVGGFALEECVAAVAAAAGLSDAEQDQLLAELIAGSDADSLADILERLFTDETELDFGDLPEWLTLEEICSIYGVDVLPVVVERPEPPPQPTPVVKETVPTVPTEVLGVSRQLPITGTDALVIVLFGLSLVGLGYLALRRTRREPS